MRHLKSGRALGVKPAHRQAMLRNMVTSLLEHQQIKTTLARAKELRKPLDKMITLGNIFMHIMHYAEGKSMGKKEKARVEAEALKKKAEENQVPTGREGDYFELS